MSANAVADFDGNGSTETNEAELTGLNGRQVTLLAEQRGDVLAVYAINGMSTGS